MREDGDWASEAKRASQNDAPASSDPAIEYFLSRYQVTGKVLDAGCGIGRVTRLFKRLGYAYVGIDQCPQMLEYARQRNPDTTYILMRMQQMNFTQEFSLVLTSGVLQHISHEQQIICMAKIRATLKPKGFFLMTEATYSSPGYDDGFCFNYEGWVKFIDQQGFKFIEFKELPLQHYLFQKT